MSKCSKAGATDYHNQSHTDRGSIVVKPERSDIEAKNIRSIYFRLKMSENDFGVMRKALAVYFLELYVEGFPYHIVLNFCLGESADEGDVEFAFRSRD